MLNVVTARYQYFNCKLFYLPITPKEQKCKTFFNQNVWQIKYPQINKTICYVQWVQKFVSKELFIG